MSATTDPASPVPNWRTPLVVIIAGCMIATIGFGLRSSFGLFLEPMTTAKEWNREIFSLAMAIQNLMWGLGVPIAGALADRYGSARVIIFGAVAYGLGIWGMANAETSLMLHVFGGALTGLGVAFTSFSLAMAAMARVVGPERRSLVLGLGTAAGSFGQVLFTPMGQAFIELYGWHDALMIWAVTAMAIVPLAFILPRAGSAGVTDSSANMTLAAALSEAMRHRGYILLTLGFFVCGFHVAFIAVHFPAYVADLGLDPAVGAYALALVGLTNIAGSLLSGVAGQKYSKRISLSLIYFLRALAITGLLLADKNAVTIYAFAIAMGVLWLSTVPLTTGLVAQIFGVRYMATLFGIVFVSHQLGSFLGIWLGGYLFDTYGTYDAIWWAGVVLGLVAAALHWPIDERPVQRTAPAE